MTQKYRAIEIKGKAISIASDEKRDFNVTEFRNIINESDSNSDKLSVKEWIAYAGEKANIQYYASGLQLACLANLENINAVFINEGLERSDRLTKLNQIAIYQMKLLTEDRAIEKQVGESRA